MLQLVHSMSEAVEVAEALGMFEVAEVLGTTEVAKVPGTTEVAKVLVQVGSGDYAGPVLQFGDACYGVREVGYTLYVENGVVFFSYQEVMKSTD